MGFKTQFSERHYRSENYIYIVAIGWSNTDGKPQISIAPHGENPKWRPYLQSKINILDVFVKLACQLWCPRLARNLDWIGRDLIV